MIQASQFDIVRKLVKEKASIVIGPDKNYLIEARLGSLARKQGIKTLEELLAILAKSPLGDLADNVVEAMTTNETSFFRDLSPFEEIKTSVLPELIQARTKERKLTIWCAASSSGQEPYSLAMLLRENFPELLQWDVSILCTDISKEMIKRTEDGTYSQLEVNRGLPINLLIKYFTQLENEYYQISNKIREIISTRILNLATDVKKLPRVDLIMMRNVLIYFDLETKEKILTEATSILNQPGYLFLGAAETTVNLKVPLKRIRNNDVAYYTKA